VKTYLDKTFPFLALTLCSHLSAAANSQYADLVLTNGEVYTMEASNPWASHIALNNGTIVAVENSSEAIEKFIGPDTRAIDLKSKFVLPGFIDAHTHFNAAGRQIIDVNLLKVSNDQGLVNEIKRVSSNIAQGEWITGGLWGAYEQWADGSDKAKTAKGKRWKPTRSMIDPTTQKHPCFLWSFDRALYLANTLALKTANLENAKLPGMELDNAGNPTGLIMRDSPAVEKIKAVVKKKSHRRMLDENRAALKHLAQCGIVEIHDIVHPDQTQRFIELQENGELSCRVWLRPDLARTKEFAEKELTRGLHPKSRQPDNMLRYGAFKGYIDGIMGNHSALFFDAYSDRPNHFGYYRHHTSDDPPPYKTGNMEKIYKYLLEAHEIGMVANVHSIGTKGSSLMLDTYERLMKDLGRDLEGYRVIHAQVIKPEDFSRFKSLNVIAEVNPYHLSDDMRWMEERIGHDRCQGAYAFRSLLDNGAMLSFASDWPGTNAAQYHAHPKYLIHAAVNRTTIKGAPQGGWFPDQKITVEEALRAYTINNAKAAFEEHLRGSLKVGKLADITVCDRNLLKIPSSQILDMKIEMTIVDGKIVYERN